MIGPYSGVSGVAWKINELLGLRKTDWISKKNHKVHSVYTNITQQYEAGRTTCFSNHEIRSLIKHHFPEYFPRNEEQSNVLIREMCDK